MYLCIYLSTAAAYITIFIYLKAQLFTNLSEFAIFDRQFGKHGYLYTVQHVLLHERTISKNLPKKPKNIYIYIYKMSNGFRKYLTIKRLTYTCTHILSKTKIATKMLQVMGHPKTKLDKVFDEKMHIFCPFQHLVLIH